MGRAAGTLAVAIVTLAAAATADADWSPGVARVIASAQKERPAAAPPEGRLAGAAHIDGRAAPRGLVTFTFDDGPSWATTPKILAALNDHDLRASFFVCGYLFTGATERAEKNRGVLAYQLAKGHLVGNHTFRHTNLQLAKESDAIAAIRDNDRALFDAAQVRPRLFRAPYRRLTDAVRRYLGDLGYVHADWNVDALDFQLSDPDEIKDAIMKQIRAREGGIVILHDNKPATAKAFPLILRALTDENCKRLRKGKEPIVPVELDYFATDADGNPLPVPEEVVARTAATRARIVARCTATSRK